MANGWYEKLLDYFPVREMKTKEQFEFLMADKGDEYKKEEGPDYILLYQEKPDYMFIDYILVNGSQRGKGMGSRLIERLKRKRKAIILEVEPEDEKDPSTLKRILFYEKNGFKEIQSIQYQRIHPETKELNTMNVFYWSPSRKTDEWVFEKMSQIYIDIHAYKAEEFYGQPAQPVEEVLKLKKQKFSRAE